ncbi:MAG: hypothetical protein WCO93_01625 [bacterium]
MKKIRIITLLVIFAATFMTCYTSCKQIKDLANVDVTYDLPKISFQFVPTTLKTGEEVLYSGIIRINLDSLLSHYGLDAGTISSVSFSNFSLTISAPSEANFDWLTSAAAMVSPNNTFSPSTVVAAATNTGSGSKTITLTTNNTNIAEYLNSTEFYLKVTAVTNGTVPYEWINMYILGTLQMTISPI